MPVAERNRTSRAKPGKPATAAASRLRSAPASGAKPGQTTGRRVKLFKNGRSQAVRIPREFELPGSEAVICKDGNALIITPAPTKSLLDVLAGFRKRGPLPPEDRMPPIAKLPAEPFDPEP